MTDLLSALQKKYDLDQVSGTPLTRPLTIDFYKKWLQQNFHGEMTYLETHAETKEFPQKLNAELKTAITVAQNYFPTLQPTETTYPARIALYARNNDYHFWLKEKLNKMIEDLKQQFPDHHFLPHVDSGPVLERDLAYRSGLGWFGKNTCLIHPQKGSLFFIAEILTTLEPHQIALETLEPLPDFCGHCTKCMDICPTQAIKEPHVLKADECISYLTIESKKVPPVDLRAKISDWFFGCDLCQTVCPWNQKVFRQKKLTSPWLSTEPVNTGLDRGEQIDFFRSILTSSNKQIQKRFFGTALFRSGGFGLKRNALIVIANLKMTELKNEVLLQKQDPKLAELAEWCALELN